MKSKIKLLLLFLLVTGPLVHASNKKEVSDTLLKKNVTIQSTYRDAMAFSFAKGFPPCFIAVSMQVLKMA